MLSTFKPPNALYSKFEQLKILEKTSVRQNGGARLGEFPSIGPSKISNFLIVTVRWIKFSEWMDIKTKLNLTKTWGATMRFPPPNGPSKIQTFNLDT